MIYAKGPKLTSFKQLVARAHDVYTAFSQNHRIHSVADLAPLSSRSPFTGADVDAYIVSKAGSFARAQ